MRILSIILLLSLASLNSKALNNKCYELGIPAFDTGYCAEGLDGSWKCVVIVISGADRCFDDEQQIK